MSESPNDFVIEMLHPEGWARIPDTPSSQKAKYLIHDANRIARQSPNQKIRIIRKTSNRACHNVMLNERGYLSTFRTPHIGRKPTP